MCERVTKSTINKYTSIRCCENEESERIRPGGGVDRMVVFWLATREGRDRVGESEDIFLKQIIKGTPKRS